MMLQVENLRKEYDGVTVVENMSFQLAAGQTLVLAGSSGSGKTTTLKMLNRLIEPTAGRIMLKEQEVTQMPVTELRRRMGYVIQTIGLFPHHTILDNILTVPRLQGWPDERSIKRAFVLLERLGLAPAEFKHRFPNELSGGQRQRVGIARALAADPPIILMDEPFGALDPITRQSLRNDFLELAELKEKTIVLVTHDVEEAFMLGDQICLMHEGKIQQMGTPRQLLFSPANAYVRNFIGDQFLPLARRSFCLADLVDVLPVGSVSGPLYHANDNLFEVQSRMNRQATEQAYFQHQQQAYHFDPLSLETAFYQKMKP